MLLCGGGGSGVDLLVRVDALEMKVVQGRFFVLEALDVELLDVAVVFFELLIIFILKIK